MKRARWFDEQARALRRAFPPVAPNDPAWSIDLLGDCRSNPRLRPMTEAELAEWRQRSPRWPGWTRGPGGRAELPSSNPLFIAFGAKVLLMSGDRE